MKLAVAKRRLERIAWWQARGVPAAEAVRRPDEPILAALRSCFVSTRRRALKRGMSFTITLSQVETLNHIQDGRCAITGIPFTLEKVGRAARRPFAPSLDRKNCAEGYVPRNVRLVCVAVNIAMNEWGLDVLRQISLAMLEKTNGKS